MGSIVMNMYVHLYRLTGTRQLLRVKVKQIDVENKATAAITTTTTKPTTVLPTKKPNISTPTGAKLDKTTNKTSPKTTFKPSTANTLTYKSTVPASHTSHDNRNRSNESCLLPAVSEFPGDVFNQTQRKHGAVIFHLFIALYMFAALAIICDYYFVSSLEVICHKLKLQADVAGATLMAVGSSAPELFASLIGKLFNIMLIFQLSNSSNFIMQLDDLLYRLL